MGDDHVLVTELQSMLPHTPPHPPTHTHTHTHTHTCTHMHTNTHICTQILKGLEDFENFCSGRVKVF